jgi:hypothetical protein
MAAFSLHHHPYYPSRRCRSMFISYSLTWHDSGTGQEKTNCHITKCVVSITSSCPTILAKTCITMRSFNFSTKKKGCWRSAHETCMSRLMSFVSSHICLMHVRNQDATVCSYYYNIWQGKSATNFDSCEVMQIQHHYMQADRRVNTSRLKWRVIFCRKFDGFMRCGVTQRRRFFSFLWNVSCAWLFRVYIMYIN